MCPTLTGSRKLACMLKNGDQPSATAEESLGNDHDIVCVSHLRWDFVFQRPQHLMTRLARDHRVFFVEEPRHGDGEPRLEMRVAEGGVRVVVPVLPQPGGPADAATGEINQDFMMGALLNRLIEGEEIDPFVLWTYTPMALPMARRLRPTVVVYDCMDDLSGFLGAPPTLRELDARLMAIADLVITGGHSLYQARKDQNPNIHPIPSSVDVGHFGRARQGGADPDDQRSLPRPRIGFAGVIDERMDLELIAGVADARPDWQLVLLGPVVKIDPATIPERPNVHLLGMKSYQILPEYMAHWDVGMLPFAHNAATRFISPTKTPEYLAAGLPVVSTSIRDVVDPYGGLGLAEIADDVPGFISAIEKALGRDRTALRSAADTYLAQHSWDDTAARVRGLVLDAIARVQLQPDEVSYADESAP
jgi:glycosyltransferase involved in cell wall biosynthesis